MIRKGTLENGFKYEFDEQRLHNWHFLKAVRDSNRPDTAYAFIDVVEQLLGPEQTDELVKYIEANGGEATIEVIGDIVQEITSTVSDDLKNS